MAHLRKATRQQLLDIAKILGIDEPYIQTSPISDQNSDLSIQMDVQLPQPGAPSDAHSLNSYVFFLAAEHDPSSMAGLSTTSEPSSLETLHVDPFSDIWDNFPFNTSGNQDDGCRGQNFWSRQM